jgi:hypothetical protein
VAVGLRRRRLLHGCPVINFHQFHLTHHERRHRPASDHPQDKEEEERRAGRRSRPLRLQEKEEGARRLSLCPDGRTGGFLEHKGLSGIPSYLSKLPTPLNSTRNESLRLPKQCRQVPILSPPRPHPPSPPTIRPPQRLMLSSNNLRLPRDDHRTHPRRSSRIRNC